jgi:hypothetical protein
VLVFIPHRKIKCATDSQYVNILLGNTNFMRTLSRREAGISNTVLIVASIASITADGVYAQSLGKVFFEEKGKITSQKPLGANKMEVSYSSNGTMNDNIDLTTIGNFMSTSRGNNVTYNQGEAAIKTKDGTEYANYTFLAIGRLEGGKPIFIGASVYDTNSTGKLAFLDNQVGIFKVEIDKQGNFVNKEWEWK